MRDVGTAGPVRRMTVRWDGGGWAVVSETRVDAMTLPAGDRFAPGQDPAATHGFWFELTDAQGRVLYRQGVEHPLLPHEVFDDEGEPYRPGTGGGPAEFEILVPDLPEAAEVRFVTDERPDTREGLARMERAEVVGRVSMKPDERTEEQGSQEGGQEQRQGEQESERGDR